MLRCDDVGMHLTQIRLIVSDFSAMAAYYRDVIGLAPQYAEPSPPYAAFTPAHGSSLCLHERADLAGVLGETLAPAPTVPADTVMIALRVNDLAAYLDGLTTRGGQVLAGPVEFGGRIRSAYLRDPEHNLIEIQQWLQVRDGGEIPSAD